MCIQRDHQGCSDGKLSGDSSLVPSLSQFSLTPTDVTNTSDEEIVNVNYGDGNGVQVPDYIQMNVPFPPEHIPVEPTQIPPVPIEVHENQIPFPPTHDPEVLEPEPTVKPHSYRSIQDSEYFRSSMVRRKTTKKLPKNQPKNTSGLGAGKQPQTPIPPKPLRQGARYDVDNAISAGKLIPCKGVPRTGRIK